MVVALLGFGCAKSNEVTIDGPDGSSTVSRSGDKTVVETDKGKLEIDEVEGGFKMTGTDEKGRKTTIVSSGDFDLDDLGVPLYPGAKIKAGAEGKSSVTGPMGKMMTVVMATADSPEKVVDFYQKELRDPKPFTSPEAGLVNGENGAGDSVTVAAALDAESKSTMVTLSVTTKKAK